MTRHLAYKIGSSNLIHRAAPLVIYSVELHKYITNKQMQHVMLLLGLAILNDVICVMCTTDGQTVV